MSLSSIGSIILGFVSLIAAFVLEGGHIGSLLEPTAAIIVFGGTIGAVGLSSPIEDVKRIPGMFKVVFSEKKNSIPGLIDYFRDIAIKTRKNGLLSIESDIASDTSTDPFILKGLQMIVDGVEPSTVRGTLESSAYITFERHKAGAAIFDAAGGFAPTMGIIGTVMGLVHVLGNLEDPKSLGPKIAVAFIATLYGVASANLMWLPIGNRLKSLNKKEMIERELIIEAIVGIQEGTNPNILVEKMRSFVDSKKVKNQTLEVQTD